MKSWQYDSPSGESCRLRLVRDTRVKAFTYEEALNYLKEKNSLYGEFTYDVFTSLDPEQELLQAVEDYYLPLAYAELENKYSEIL